MLRHLTVAATLLTVALWTPGAIADIAPDPEDCTESWWEGNGREDCQECVVVDEDYQACEDQFAGTDYHHTCSREVDGQDVQVWCTPANGDDDDDDDGPICHMAAPAVAAPLAGGLVALGLTCLFITRRRG